MTDSIIVYHYSSQSNTYYKIGYLMGTSLMQCGSGYPFFNVAVYDYICGKDTNSLFVDYSTIPSDTFREIVGKVSCGFKI